MTRFDKVDVVFEGGGVKGSALVGAAEHLETSGLSLQNVVGTSAGAVVAALLAAGYPAREVRDIMEGLDYRRFQDMTNLDRLPFIGPMLSLLRDNGFYAGYYIEDWLRRLLAEAPRAVHTFGDLHMPGETPQSKYFYRLQVIATDLTRRKQLVLPWDIRDYGGDPEQLDVAWAVRMSMGLPLFFAPVQLRDTRGETCFIVDGGLLSNFPVDILDDDRADPPWPTLGLKLVDRLGTDGSEAEEPNRIRGPLSLLKAMVSTMLEAHDMRYIQLMNFDRTIAIPTLGVRTTDFGIRRERIVLLHQSGVSAAESFLNTWDFHAWIQKHRVPAVSRQQAAELRERVG